VRYLGGKAKIAKFLAACIHEIVPDARCYWDPFCGGLSMSAALSAYAPTLASDICAPLISLYRAVQAGWDPPVSISPEQYAAAKMLPDSDPLKAFCGFGLSFSGKWFAGYAGGESARVIRGGPRAGYIVKNKPTLAVSKGLRRDVPRIGAIELIDWLCVEPFESDGCVLYLDPPYANSLGYEAVRAFDHSLFLNRVRSWSRYSHIFVSEYDFCLGECVWAASSRARGLAPEATRRLERLYWIRKGSL
jgi:DNA adenine methylase